MSMLTVTVKLSKGIKMNGEVLMWKYLLKFSLENMTKPHI